MAGLFGVGSGTALVFLTGLIGGLVGGLGAVTGIAFRKLFDEDGLPPGDLMSLR